MLNNRYKEINSPIFIAGDPDQFNSSRIREDLKEKTPFDNNNVFQNDSLVEPWFKYEDLDSRAVANTFSYIFYKFKKGIFVRIANNKLESFLPFINLNYRNEFGDRIKVSPFWEKKGGIIPFLNYISKKKGFNNSQQVLPVEEWVANNALVRFEKRTDEIGNNLAIFENMLQTLCEKRDVPDIEFFINRRDFPLLKTNNTEPYNHMFDSEHQPLLSHQYDKYSPILSGSASGDFADILMPTYEDWSRAMYQSTGSVLPSTLREYPSIVSIPWAQKINKAVFRGATTGAGVTVSTNQRLKALQIAENNPNYLDVQLKWNLRPRKFEGNPYLQTIERDKYPVPQQLSLQEQSAYKYILTLEGHVAAFRLSYELSSGSVVLLAESRWKLWYQYKLQPYVHFIPVKEDLSDLLTQIQWCEKNDKKCEEITVNAKNFYTKYLNSESILDYLQKLLWDIVNITGVYSYLPDLLLWSVENERTLLLNQQQQTTTNYMFNIPNQMRSIGHLDGIGGVVRSKQLNDLTWIRQIFQNVNGTVDLFQTNNLFIVGKRPFYQAKELEHIHESYVGQNAINSIVGKVPNFCYTYGSLLDTGADKQPIIIFSEYITGVTFMKWLQSPEYSFSEMLIILVQLNLALISAQNMIGFIHYDLFPWNVMISPIEREEIYDYVLNFNTVISLRPRKNNPVIIDYGKSRCVVYEASDNSDHGLFDHGFSNLFKVNGLVDTLSLLYGTLSILKNKLSSSEMEALLEYPRIMGVDRYRDISYNTKYGVLFNQPRVQSQATRPKTFVDFMVTKFSSVFKNVLFIKKTAFSYPLENGHPVFTQAQARGVNPYIEVIKHVDRHGVAASNDEFFQTVAKDIFFRRTKWIDNIMMTNKYANDMWIQLKNKLVIDQKPVNPTPITFKPVVDYPKPPLLFLDFEITPRELQSINPQFHYENWTRVWLLCFESYLFGILNTDSGKFYKDMMDFVAIDGFIYNNALVSNNTAYKLKKTFLPEEDNNEYLKLILEHFENYGGGAGGQEILSKRCEEISKKNFQQT
jgi:hypothetical protein